MATIPPWEKYAAATPKAAPDDTAAWDAYANAGAAASPPDTGTPPPAPQAAPQTGLDVTKQRLGVLARGLASGPTSTATFMGDMLNRGINRAGALIGHDPQLGMPSAALQNMMTSAGLPQAQTTTEKIVQALAAMATGSRDPIMSAATNAARITPAAATQLDPRQAAIAAGQKLGYVVPPSEAQGGAAGNALEWASDKASLYNSMGLHNQNLTNALSRKIVGIPPGQGITQDLIDAAKQDTYTQGYGPIKALGTITTGKVYGQALDKVLNDFQGAPGSFPLATKNDVKGLVEAYRVPRFDSAHAVDAIQNLRSEATTNFRTGNENLAQAQQAVAKALENNIELNLSSPNSQAAQSAVAQGLNPADILSQFRNSRIQLAKQNVIDKALEKGTGSINLQKIGSQLKRNGENYLTGDLSTMGNFAVNAQKVTNVPTAQSIPVIRHPVAQLLSTVAAHLAGGPAPAALVAGLPFGQAGLRNRMMTPWAQRMIGPQQLDPGILEQLASNPSVLNALPAASQGLFGPPTRNNNGR